MTQMPGSKRTVLLIDDSEDDRLFMRRALHQHHRLAVVGEVCDGEEAVAYLSGEGVFANRADYPFPDILLLDLKMPRKTGFEVLQWLQTQAFQDLVVIVVSGSSLREDVTKSTALGADAYLKKGALKEEYAAMVREIEASLDQC
ncbi:MAG: putative response regulator, CheY [Pedosphaera sp.]|nr:putative response regulator, CheY [Pedosphaera sp.]